MNPMIPILLYAGAYALLFATWAAVVFLKVPGADSLVQYIQLTLTGLTGHVLTLINPRTTTMPAPPDLAKQAGFALLPMLAVLIVGALLLSGCGALNAYTGAALNSAEAGYTGAKQNAKSTDDMKFILWVDTACAIPLGSLARNASGNPNAVSAALTACPVANMGIITAKDGQVQVQITQPTPTRPYVAPTAAGPAK